MKLYVVKNDDGKLWDYDHSCWSNSNGGNYTSGKSYAEDTVDFRGGHVVPLVENPKPVEVSEDMASWLSNAKEMRMPIEFLARCKVPDGDQEDMLRAYVNGWVVEKPKLWNVKVPHVDAAYYMKLRNGNLSANSVFGNKDHSQQFTEAEIEHYGLQDCECVEVIDDEQ